ncbi:MAG TPA: hypothetical protein VJU16_03785, partial [Planctomycetota bacterium]|nr:hypothetical protein [Planctomycetota bacterium]
MNKLVAQQLSHSAAFRLSMIPAAIAAILMAVVAVLAPGESWHGVDSRLVIGAIVMFPVFFLVLFVGFMVLALDLRARSAIVFGALLGCPLAYLIGLQSPLVRSDSWTALLVASMVVVFPLCALLAWRLRFRTTTPRPREDDEAVALSGYSLSDEEAEALESRLRVNPNDEACRLKLLGYLLRRSILNSSLRERFATHVVWFLERGSGREIVGTPWCQAPMPDRGYSAIADAWERVLTSTDITPETLFNAAKFYSLSDPDRSR